MQTKAIGVPVWVVGLVLGLAPAGEAEVVDAAAHGFAVRTTLAIAAPPAKVYQAVVRDVGSWWHPDHTFSGDASKLRIEAKPGGCFCEKLGRRGGVRHLEVVYAEPGKRLRMRGGLGPLQEMAVTGSFSIELEPAERRGTRLVMTYRVGGYRPEGLERLAPVVDLVLAEQMQRLRAYVETGSPTVRAEP